MYVYVCICKVRKYKELKKDTELLKTVTKNTSSENRLIRQYAEKIHAEVNNPERYSRKNHKTSWLSRNVRRKYT